MPDTSCSRGTAGLHQLRQRLEPLAREYRVRTGRQIGFRRVAGIGSRHDDACAAQACRADHFAGGTPHRAQAHLAQEIEIVFIDHQQLRRAFLQAAAVVLQAVGEHGVEQRHLMPLAPQHACNLERGQRRIGLGPLDLLGIKPQKIGVRNQNRQHQETHGKPSPCVEYPPAGGRFRGPDAAVLTPRHTWQPGAVVGQRAK
jgi:hypothetical protein